MAVIYHLGFFFFFSFILVFKNNYEYSVHLLWFALHESKKSSRFCGGFLGFAPVLPYFSIFNLFL